MKPLLIFFLNHKVGLRGTCFSWEEVSVLAELEFLYKVPTPSKAMVKGAPMEEDFSICPNFVTVTQGLPRLVQEPPPPGLIPAPGLDDSEISEYDSEEEEEEGQSASVGGHFRQILKFFKTLF